MLRTVKNHHLEEEEDDEDFNSRTTDGSSQKDGRRNDQKASSHRSKHSETEQRRRSKINERFQILRDLIPQNDQKRDRASFLLEVIQYIQFLQEKLQIYEGTYQGWSPEPTKLMPWRGNGVTDNFENQSQVPIRNGPVDEGNIVFSPAMLSSTQSLVEPDMSNPFATTTDHHGSLTNVDLLVSQSRPWIDNRRPVLSENTISQSCSGNGIEDSISDAYSKGLLSNLTQALGSYGVDLSQANISVQFDVRKGISSGSTSTSFGIKEHDFLSSSNQATGHCGIRNTDDDVYGQVPKRLRTDQNQ